MRLVATVSIYFWAPTGKYNKQFLNNCVLWFWTNEIGKYRNSYFLTISSCLDLVSRHWTCVFHGLWLSIDFDISFHFHNFATWDWLLSFVIYETLHLIRFEAITLKTRLQLLLFGSLYVKLIQPKCQQYNHNFVFCSRNLLFYNKSLTSNSFCHPQISVSSIFSIFLLISVLEISKWFLNLKLR